MTLNSWNFTLKLVLRKEKFLYTESHLASVMWSIPSHVINIFYNLLQQRRGDTPQIHKHFFRKKFEIQGGGGVPPSWTETAKGYWEPPSVILGNAIGVSVWKFETFYFQGGMSHKKHPVIWGSPQCQFWGSPRFLDVSFEGPLTCWMSVLRVPSLAGCQFWGSPHLLDVSFEGPLTCWMSVFRGSPHLLGCHVVLILVKIGS